MFSSLRKTISLILSLPLLLEALCVGFRPPEYSTTDISVSTVVILDELTFNPSC